MRVTSGVGPRVTVPLGVGPHMRFSSGVGPRVRFPSGVGPPEGDSSGNDLLLGSLQVLVLVSRSL